MIKKKKILLAHGGGGSLSQELIKDLILKNFKGKPLEFLEDSAVLNLKGNRFAYTTDSYVVKPLFFPGGDIGKLAVAGTINDLAMMGAKPLYLTLSFIVEEGLDFDILEKIINSIKKTSAFSGVKIVAGDLKVVEYGSADKIFINTSGVGLIDKKTFISSHNARMGDRIILSGTVAEHGLTILSQRQSLSFASRLKSDCAPLYSLVKEMLREGADIHALRDPTRGGVAAVLNEIASSSRVSMEIEERKIPVRKSVQALADLLGLDPLNIPNEGKLIALVDKKAASRILARMRRHPLGRKTEIIGRVVKGSSGQVTLRTKIGGERIIDSPLGEELPRIC